jgi:hypothetical protein
MIHYILAAAFGALIGSQSKKSYAKGGEIEEIDEDYYSELKEKGIDRYSFEASQLWKQKYRDRYKKAKPTYAEGGEIGKFEFSDGIGNTAFGSVEKELEGKYKNFVSVGEAVERDMHEYTNKWYGKLSKSEFSDGIGNTAFGSVEKELEGKYKNFVSVGEAVERDMHEYTNKWYGEMGSTYAKGGKTYAHGGGVDYIELVHAYNDDGTMFGTGELEKIEGDKTFVRFDSERVKEFDSDKVRLVMAKGGKMFTPQGREILYQDENVALQHNTVTDHYSMINPDTGVYMAKGGKTDDLGNPTEPKILEKMEIFIKNEIPKLDRGRFFTDGMQRKEAKKRFYQRFEYGAYNPKFAFDFAKGGKTNTVSKQNTFRRITEDSLNPYFLFTQYGDDIYVDDNVTLLNGSADLQFKRTPKDFKPSPMSGLPYEIKKIIRNAGGFEYFSYGEMGGKKSISLRDGSWGDIYIEFENVTLNEIKEALLPLAETVKEDLEEKGIKGYGELGYNSYGNYLDLEISEDNEENYAKGGVTEHGLQKGDTIIEDIFWTNKAVVKPKKGEKIIVDLDKGKRFADFAKGGKTLPRPAKDFIAYVIDMDGNATLKYSKTFQGANRMMKNLMKKIQDVSTHGISKYDPFYGTRVGKMFFEPIKSLAQGGKTQGYDDRGDEELGMTDGKESRFKQSKKDRRDEMKGENRAARNKTYGSFEKGGKTNWVQDVVDSPDFRKGAFTKKAKERGLTPEEFMRKVLKNPDKYNERTRRQAQFMKNIKD